MPGEDVQIISVLTPSKQPIPRPQSTRQIPPSASLPMSGLNIPTAQACTQTQNDTVTHTNTQMCGKEQFGTKHKCTDRYKKTN